MRRAVAMARLNPFRRHMLILRFDAGGLLEAFLVAGGHRPARRALRLAVSRLPDAGRRHLHIAHMLWGGLAMMAAVVMLLVSVSRLSAEIAAVHGRRRLRRVHRRARQGHQPRQRLLLPADRGAHLRHLRRARARVPAPGAHHGRARRRRTWPTPSSSPKRPSSATSTSRRSARPGAARALRPGRARWSARSPPPWSASSRCRRPAPHWVVHVRRLARPRLPPAGGPLVRRLVVAAFVAASLVTFVQAVLRVAELAETPDVSLDSVTHSTLQFARAGSLVASLGGRRAGRHGHRRAAPLAPRRLPLVPAGDPACRSYRARSSPSTWPSSRRSSAWP